MDKRVKGALRFACHSAPASAKRSNVVAVMVGSPVVCVPAGRFADGQLGDSRPGVPVAAREPAP